MRVQDQPNGPVHSRPAAPRPPLEDFARRAVVAVLIGILLLSLAYLFWRGSHVLLQAFAGVLFAVFLSALADWLRQHTRLSYGWSLTVVVLVLVGTVTAVGWLLANQLALQMREMSQRMPE